MKKKKKIVEAETNLIVSMHFLERSEHRSGRKSVLSKDLGRTTCLKITYLHGILDVYIAFTIHPHHFLRPLLLYITVVT